MKKIFMVLFCSLFMLVACEAGEVNEKDKVNEESPGAEEVGLVSEAENEEFKLIVTSEKDRYALDEKIPFMIEIHNMSDEEELTVYTNSTLLYYHLIGEDNEVDVRNEGADMAEVRTIVKGEPNKETLVLDKEDQAYGDLLENMNAGKYTIIFRVAYGKDGYMDRKEVSTQLEFEIQDEG